MPKSVSTALHGQHTGILDGMDWITTVPEATGCYYNSGGYKVFAAVLS